MLYLFIFITPPSKKYIKTFLYFYLPFYLLMVLLITLVINKILNKYGTFKTDNYENEELITLYNRRQFMAVKII